MFRQVGAAECTAVDVGDSRRSLVVAFVSVMGIVSAVVAVHHRKQVILVLGHLGDVRPPYAGAVVVAVVECVAVTAVLLLSGFAGAHTGQMASLATPPTDHGGGALGLVVVAHHSTFVANHGFALGSDVATLMAVITEGTETLLGVDGGPGIWISHTEVTSLSSEFNELIGVVVDLVKRE